MERAQRLDDVLVLTGRMSQTWTGEAFSAQQIHDDGAEAQLRRALEWAPEPVEVEPARPVDAKAQVVAMADWVARTNREMGGD